MRRILMMLALSAAGVAVPIQPAHAASFKRCGGAGTVESRGVGLTNVQTTRTACRTAKRFARTFTLKAGVESDFVCDESFYCTWRGWSCRNDGRNPDKIKHRCETPVPNSDKIKVIKWVERHA